MKKNNLRISILQQAIEGKLVPQLAADGNAQDLVDNIREHKAELVSEKKLKKDPNESYIYRDDEGHFMERIGKQEPVCIDKNLPFVVPEGWTWARLGEIVNMERGVTFPSSDKNYEPHDGLIPCLRTSNIQESVEYGDLLYIDESYIKGNTNKIVVPSDIILSSANSKELVGKTAFVDKVDKKITFGGFLMVLRSMGENPKFLFLLLRWLFYTNVLSKKSKQTTNIANLSSDILSSFLLPLPPLAEQARIVKKMEELMPLAEKFEKQSEELELLNGALPGKLRKSILQHAIKGLLVPQLAADGNAQDLVDNIREHKAELIREKKLKKDPNESYIYRDDEGHFMERIGKQEPVCIDNDLPFAVPEGWTWARLGEIGEMTIGKTPPRDCNIYWSNGEFPWVSISDMRDEITSTREKLASTAIPLFSKISPKGSLLMSFKLTIGKVSILRIDAYHNEAIITIKPYVDEDYKIRNYLFKILPLMSQFVQGRNAIKGKTLNLKSLHSLLLPLPPLAEQERIVKKVEELMEKVDKMEKAMV
jgi:type I restriction enzyme S subunit